MTELAGLKRLTRNLTEFRRDVAEAIVSQHHASLGHVQFLQGKVEALDTVLGEIDHIRKSIDEEDDDGSAATS